MGDIHKGIADAVNRFFVGWRQLLFGLLSKAKEIGSLKSNADCDALSNLIMSTIEGSILICKASKDQESFMKTLETLKSVIRSYRA